MKSPCSHAKKSGDIMEMLTDPADNFREAKLFRPARRSSTEAWRGKTRGILL
jgi:hypothetical protein